MIAVERQRIVRIGVMTLTGGIGGRPCPRKRSSDHSALRDGARKVVKKNKINLAEIPNPVLMLIFLVEAATCHHISEASRHELKQTRAWIW